MAFNPFNIFRRNQKVFFAVVTVFTMFTFVLSSGAGGNNDFFEWLPNWLAGKSTSKKGEVVAVIDGKKVYEQELRDIRLTRTIANQYMARAAMAAANNINRDITTRSARLPRERQGQFTNDAGFFFACTIQPVPPAQAEQLRAEISRRLEEVKKNLKDLKGEDAELAMETWTLGTMALQRVGYPADLYFTSIPNRSDRDAIEFKLWQKKADQYGIHFNVQDVKKLVVDEFSGRLGEPEKEIRKEVTKDRGVSESRIWESLGEEFRVRMAQMSVIGEEYPRASGTLSPAPVYTTPYDLFGFYKDKFSTTNFEALSIPVANFVDQVTEKPSDAELEKLYRDYSNVEPNPASEKPGFKEPRKAKFEWVSATGTEPYYKAAAKESLKQGELYAKLGGLLTLPLPSVGPAWATCARLLVEPDLALAGPYSALRQQFQSDLDQQYSGAAFNFQPLDTSVVKPANLASLVGGMAGSLLTGAPAFYTSAELITHASRLAERKTRIEVGLPLVLGSVPGPGLFGTEMAAVAAAYSAYPKPLPVDVFKSELESKLVDLQARRSMMDDMRTFRSEIARVTREAKDANKKKAAAAAYIDEFTQKRGLKKGETTEFRDEYNIGDDPNMAPLKAIMEQAPHGTAPVRFGPQLFTAPMIEKVLQNPEYMAALQRMSPQEQQQQFMMLMNMREPETGVYIPRFYPNERGPQDVNRMTGGVLTDPSYLIWRSAERAPETVAFRSAEPKVLAAWKRTKARELAQKEAERIAAEIHAKNSTIGVQVRMALVDVEGTLKARWPDPKAQQGIKVFAIPDVAPYVTPMNFQGGMATEIRDFRLEPSSNIPYPTPEMQKQLLEERSKPINSTFVMSDLPKENYYVAAVAERREKSPIEFEQTVFNAPTFSPVRNRVMQLQREDSYRKTRESALEILKAEFKYEKENTARLDSKDKSGE